jgi:hypothetical protein
VPFAPNLYFSKTVTFGAHAPLHDIVYQTYDATFKNHAGLPSQNDLSGQINVDFRNLLTVQAYYSESAVRTSTSEYLPFDASGFLVGYKYATATPSSIQYTGGPYYHGYLDAWTSIVTLPVLINIHPTSRPIATRIFRRIPASAAAPNGSSERRSISNSIGKRKSISVRAGCLVYLVYGDPNSLITTPALFLKYIVYLGAPKGT